MDTWALIPSPRERERVSGNSLKFTLALPRLFPTWTWQVSFIMSCELGKKPPDTPEHPVHCAVSYSGSQGVSPSSPPLPRRRSYPGHCCQIGCMMQELGLWSGGGEEGWRNVALEFASFLKTPFSIASTHCSSFFWYISFTCLQSKPTRPSTRLLC